MVEAGYREDELLDEFLKGMRDSFPGTLPDPVPERVRETVQAALLGQVLLALPVADREELRASFRSWLGKRYPGGLPEEIQVALQRWLLATLLTECERAKREGTAEKARRAVLDKLLENLAAGTIDVTAAKDELEEYCEAAGFEDYGDRVLSEMDDEAVLELYVATFYSAEPQCETNAAVSEEWKARRDAEWADAVSKITIADEK